MDNQNGQDIFFPVSVPAVVMSLKVEAGSRINRGTLIATYTLSDSASTTCGQDELCLRSTVTGQVEAIFCAEGAIVQPRSE